MFEEPMVEPKQARAPLQLCTDPALVHQVQEPDIPAEPMAELSLEASNQIMSDTPAVQQEQRSEVLQAPVASSSRAGASSQGEAQVVPELPAPHVQPAVAESHRLSVSVPALDVPGPSKHCRGQKPQADTSKMDIVNFPSNLPA
ncbi:hypothetical protein C0995_000254 [Termitomyces sp. Mi166|nr:hypothetical protein C0995_000254 [Termitomyces sp. Mi166\